MKLERSAGNLTAIKLGIFHCCSHAPSVTWGKPFQFCVFRVVMHLGGQVGESRTTVHLVKLSGP